MTRSDWTRLERSLLLAAAGALAVAGWVALWWLGSLAVMVLTSGGAR